MTPEEADKLTPSIQLSKIVDKLAPANFKTDRLIIMAPDYMKALEATLKSTSEDDLQAYFLWKTIQSYASAIESDTLKPYKRFVNALQGKVGHTSLHNCEILTS
jgi:endothelin-converting enzyme